MHVLKVILKITGWFMVVSSTICLVVSLFAYLHARNFMRQATRAQGTVIRLVERESHDSGTVYHPVVSFPDAHGAQQELFSSVGSFPPPYKVGEQVTVLYPADQPKKAKLDRFFDVWGLAAITGGIGLFDLLIGIAILVIPVILQKYRHAPPPIPSAA